MIKEKKKKTFNGPMFFLLRVSASKRHNLIGRIFHAAVTFHFSTVFVPSCARAIVNPDWRGLAKNSGIVWRERLDGRTDDTRPFLRRVFRVSHISVHRLFLSSIQSSSSPSLYLSYVYFLG